MKCIECNFFNDQGRISCRKCGKVLAGSAGSLPGTPYSRPQRPTPNLSPGFGSDIPRQAAEPAYVHQTPPEFVKRPSGLGDNTTLQYRASGKIEATTDSRRPDGGKRKKIALSLSLTSVISLLLCLLYYSAFDNNTSGITESKFFAEAESLYLQNEYPSALQQYRNFQENFPESILLPLTSLRIASLNSALDSLQQQKHHFDNQTTNLLEKATVLAMNKQYLSPPGNNALAYLDKLNQLDPDNMEAKQLRKKIFTIYQNDAQLA